MLLIDRRMSPWDGRTVLPSNQPAGPIRIMQFILGRPRLTIAYLCALWLAAASCGMMLNQSSEMSEGEAGVSVQPPQRAPSIADLLPLDVMSMDVDVAQLSNESVPLFGGQNPASTPFVLGSVSPQVQAQAASCLTEAIYYEAGNESEAGLKAVAQVVLNRVRHPAYPDSVCGVVYQGHARDAGCQFTFTCDGSLARRPSVSGWKRAKKVAEAALAGQVFSPVGYATHYHANYVVPYWGSQLLKNAVIGTHIFYLLPGAAGKPNFFSASYSGMEQPLNTTEVEQAAWFDTPIEVEVEPKFTSLGSVKPPTLEVSQEIARELDEFGVLDYRSGSKEGAIIVNDQLGAALSKASCASTTEGSCDERRHVPSPALRRDGQSRTQDGVLGA